MKKQTYREDVTKIFEILNTFTSNGRRQFLQEFYDWLAEKQAEDFQELQRGLY